AEIDDHVREEHRRVSVAERGRQPRRPLRLSRGLRRGRFALGQRRFGVLAGRFGFAWSLVALARDGSQIAGSRFGHPLFGSAFRPGRLSLGTPMRYGARPPGEPKARGARYTTLTRSAPAIKPPPEQLHASGQPERRGRSTARTAERPGGRAPRARRSR